MTEVLRKGEIDRILKTPMLFVLGFWRSGTTLFQNALNAHPNIVGPPENDFILMLYPKFAHIKKWTEKNVMDLMNILYENNFLANQWLIDRDILTKQLLSSIEQLNYPLICKIIFF